MFLRRKVSFYTQTSCVYCFIIDILSLSLSLSHTHTHTHTYTHTLFLPLFLQIWSMVQRVQRFLSAGYSVQTWLDEDFLYSYYLWINVPSDEIGVRYDEKLPSISRIFLLVHYLISLLLCRLLFDFTHLQI